MMIPRGADVLESLGLVLTGSVRSLPMLAYNGRRPVPLPPGGFEC